MKKQITDGIEVMERVLNSYPEFHENVAEQRLGIQVSRAIYEARVAAGLSQKELAAKIGTQQSAISRFESSDYDQHSLATLYKIAEALGARVEVRIVQTSGAQPDQSDRGQGLGDSLVPDAAGLVSGQPTSASDVRHKPKRLIVLLPVTNPGRVNGPAPAVQGCARWWHDVLGLQPFALSRFRARKGCRM